jgi:3-phenylpropionate/trans-cinnamate dioxygenase ferredoxin subunit
MPASETNTQRREGPISKSNCAVTNRKVFIISTDRMRGRQTTLFNNLTDFIKLRHRLNMDWIKVFSSEAEARQRLVSNKPQLLVLHGKRICLLLHNNTFFAVQDACTHNGESLSKGQVNYLGEIICPWHNYRFDLRSGKACDSSCRDLVTYLVKIDETGFFVGI